MEIQPSTRLSGYSIISAKLCKQNTHAAKTYKHNNNFYLNTIGLKVRAYGRRVTLVFGVELVS